MGDNPHARDNPPVLGDEIGLFNGSPTEADQFGQRPINQAIGLTISKGDGIAAWVGDADPVPTREAGTYGYAAGTIAATVDIPADGRLQRVFVIATENGPASVRVGSGDIITVPADAAFDEQIPGSAVGTDVTIGGNVLAYYVSWVA